MRVFKKVLFWAAGVGLVLYIGVCVFFYFDQEHLIFPGTKVAGNYKYDFHIPNKEYRIKAGDSDTIDAYLFKVAKPKGLIFYLHGNADNADSWSDAVVKYANLGYDCFEMDYPGYGKSSGHISSLLQFFTSVKAAYDTMRKIYPENRITYYGLFSWQRTRRMACSALSSKDAAVAGPVL